MLHDAEFTCIISSHEVTKPNGIHRAASGTARASCLRLRMSGCLELEASGLEGGK